MTANIGFVPLRTAGIEYGMSGGTRARSAELSPNYD